VTEKKLRLVSDASFQGLKVIKNHVTFLDDIMNLGPNSSEVMPISGQYVGDRFGRRR